MAERENGPVRDSLEAQIIKAEQELRYPQMTGLLTTEQARKTLERLSRDAVLRGDWWLAMQAAAAAERKRKE